MNKVLLTHERLDLNDIQELVSHDSCGAVSLFVGTTRNNFEDKKVISLEYEAYEPMARKQIDLILNELRKRWPDVVNIVVHHRLGIVSVGEASVVIAVSSPHRESSLNAVSFAIDALKQRVPIWKKEQYENEEAVWKENKEYLVSENLIQIKADEDEMQRRIQCFVEKKRRDINISNIMDFTQGRNNSETKEESTCARTNSFIIKQEQSKCHIKVKRVENRDGPQTRPDYLFTLDKLMSNEDNKCKADFIHLGPNTQKSNLGTLLEERLNNIEEHLHMPKLQTAKIHERIKSIETRLLSLESLSPEYKIFLPSKSAKRLTVNYLSRGAQRPKKKKFHSVNELNTIIDRLQNDVEV